MALRRQTSVITVWGFVPMIINVWLSLLQGVTGSPPVSLDVTAIPVSLGGSVVLPCHAPPAADGRTPHVAWRRPHDGLQVTRDSEVSALLRGRARMLGDRSKGEYHLNVKYTKFPDDNGTWWCEVFNGPRLPVTVTVLVPPATPLPQITPISGIIFQVTSEAWTFTCVAHYAHPPVTLTWRQVTGPRTEYSVLPPSVVAAPDHTLSVSVNLLLGPANHGSVFACTADHPTFNGRNYSAEMQFVIADPTIVTKRGLRPGALPSPPPSTVFTPGDVALVAAGFLLLLLFLTVFALLCRSRHRWQLDARERSSYMGHSPLEKTTIIHTNGSPLVSEEEGRGSWVQRERRRCATKVTVGGVLVAVVIVMFTFIIPVYVKTFTMPVTGVDYVVPVMAGSLLWLDCSELTQSKDNLLQVGWRKGFMRFYNQYSVKHLHRPLGVAVNYTAEGRSLGPRTQMHTMGQITLWPVQPADGGLYVCEVARMLDDTGRTSFHRLTFAVLVLEGPQVSHALLAMAAVGLLSALLLFGLGIYHSLRSSEITEDMKESLS